MTTFEQDGYRDGVHGRPYAPPTHPQTGVFAAEYQRGYNAGMLYSGRTAQVYERKAREAGQKAALAYLAGSSLGAIALLLLLAWAAPADAKPCGRSHIPASHVCHR